MINWLSLKRWNQEMHRADNNFSNFNQKCRTFKFKMNNRIKLLVISKLNYKKQKILMKADYKKLKK